MLKVDDLGTLQNNDDRYIDCYVSTDVGEIEAFLENIGFEEREEEKDVRTLADYYDDSEFYGGYTLLIQPQTGLKIDGVDVPLEEAVRARKEIGFMPMSKLRIYALRDGIDKKLSPVMSQLTSERQNMAFVNESYSRVHVRLSEFYC